MDSIGDGEYGGDDESQDDGVGFDAEQAHHLFTSAYHHPLTLISPSLSYVAPFWFDTWWCQQGVSDSPNYKQEKPDPSHLDLQKRIWKWKCWRWTSTIFIKKVDKCRKIGHFSCKLFDILQLCSGHIICQENQICGMFWRNESEVYSWCRRTRNNSVSFIHHIFFILAVFKHMYHILERWSEIYGIWYCLAQFSQLRPKLRYPIFVPKNPFSVS